MRFDSNQLRLVDKASVISHIERAKLHEVKRVSISITTQRFVDCLLKFDKMSYCVTIRTNYATFCFQRFLLGIKVSKFWYHAFWS